MGRRLELLELNEMLFVDKYCQKVALVGLGGIGKTQIALSFSYSVKDNWPEYSIFWVPAWSMEAFEQACAEIAGILRTSDGQGEESRRDVRRLVRHHLSETTAGKWLLIVDNADDMDLLYGTTQSPGVPLVDYLPSGEHGLTVFTTRYYEVAQSLVGSDMVEVEKIEKGEAVEMLWRSLVRKEQLRHERTTTELLDELDYLPLAITQAAPYVNTTKVSISEYLRLLKSMERDTISIMSIELRDNTRYKESSNAIATT